MTLGGLAKSPTRWSVAQPLCDNPPKEHYNNPLFPSFPLPFPPSHPSSLLPFPPVHYRPPLPAAKGSGCCEPYRRVGITLRRSSSSIRYLPNMEYLTVMVELHLSKKYKTVSLSSPHAARNGPVHIPITVKCLLSAMWGGRANRGEIGQMHGGRTSCFRSFSSIQRNM